MKSDKLVNYALDSKLESGSRWTNKKQKINIYGLW